MLPSLVPVSEAKSYEAKIMDHIARFGKRYESKMNGKARGGWYLADFPRVPELTYIHDALTGNPRLIGLLDELHGKEEWRLLARSEMYVDSGNSWHADALTGPMTLYNLDLDFYRQYCKAHPQQQACHSGFPYRDHFWRYTLQNVSQRITTVAIYLQDHREPDNGGLSVKPHSHLRPESHQV